MADEHSTQSEDRDPERAVLTDRLLKALVYGGKRVGPDGVLISGTKSRTEGRRTVWDDWRDEHDQTTGLCITITEKGAKTFKVVRRVKGEKRPVKFTIGRYDKGEITLADARDQARKARDMMRKGINPVEEERKAREQKQRERDEEKARVSFTEVAESYISKVIIGDDPDDPELRTADTLEKQIRRDLLSRPWSKKAIVAVTTNDILQTVRDIKSDPKRSKPRKRSNAAATAFNHARRIISWALKRNDDRGNNMYGLEVNVCDRINLDEEAGTKGSSRERILSDLEIRLFWKGVVRLGYPYGTAAQFLFLSAVRLREAVHCSYPEFEPADFTAIEFHRVVEAVRFRGRVLVVPASRMKGRKRKAVAHEIPIVPALDAILAEVPKFVGAKYVFSLNGGRSPICRMAHLKDLIDEAMEQVQREELGLPDGVPIPDEHRVRHWTLHDLRRTARSLLSRLRVPRDIRERMIAHKLGGVEGTYDRHDYRDEKYTGLRMLAAEVDRIVNRVELDNVIEVEFPQAAAV